MLHFYIYKCYIFTLQNTPNYLSKKIEIVPKENRFYSYNTHEAIVNKEDFDLVQENYKRCVYTAPNAKRVHIFAGLLRCMDCNGSMAKCSKYGKYVSYKCRTYQRCSKEICSHSHVIKHEVLKEIVLSAIKSQIFAIANLSNVFQKVYTNDSVKEKTRIINLQIRKVNKDIESEEQDKIDAYKDWKRENITKKDFQLFVSNIKAQISKLESKLSHLQNELDSCKDIKEKNIDWFTKYMNQYDKEALDREMLTSLIDIIYIGKDSDVKIVFKYQDEIDKIKQFVEENKEGFYRAK